MKRKTNQHTNKSIAQRRSYSKAIKELTYDPTVDDSLDFASSDDPTDKSRIEDAPPSRPVSLGDRLIEIRDKYGLTIIGSIVLVVASYFVFDFNHDMTEVKTKQEGLEDDVKEIKSDVEKVNDKNQEQDLKLKEHEVKIHFLEQTKKK